MLKNLNMKKINVIDVVLIVFIFMGAVVPIFFTPFCLCALNSLHLLSIFIGLFVLIIAKKQLIRIAAIVLLILVLVILYENTITCYTDWPQIFERKLYLSELRRTKPELIGKENKPLMKVIWYQKDTTNLLPEHKSDVFLKYAGNYYLNLLYPILAFTFLIIALNKNKRGQRTILVLCGSLFLALMLIVLQLRYMQWKQELKLKYDTIKKELTQQTSVDYKKSIENLPESKDF